MSCILISSKVLASSPGTMTSNIIPASPVQATAQNIASSVQNENNLTVKSAWARRSMSGSSNSVAYVSLHNSSAKDIQIVGATALSVANRVEIHTTATDSDGVSRMVKLDKLVIPSGGDIVMKTGGIHIMLLDLKKALNVGDKVKINLMLQGVGVYPVELEIKDLGAGQ